MSFADAATYAGVAISVAALFYVRRKIAAQKRLRLGSILFVVGWAGILLTLRLSDLPFLQSEVVAFTVMGIFSLAIVVSLLFLVTAFSDWLGLTRPARQRFQFPPFNR